MGFDFLDMRRLCPRSSATSTLFTIPEADAVLLVVQCSPGPPGAPLTNVAHCQCGTKLSACPLPQCIFCGFVALTAALLAAEIHQLDSRVLVSIQSTTSTTCTVVCIVQHSLSHSTAQ